jgi:L-threonylcarbamoyladenylate synthase
MMAPFATQVIPVDPHHPQPERLRPAADLLIQGEVVAFPTETVYGLGANALDPAAVAKIFAAKGRPASNPLIVHIHSLAQLAQIAVDLPDLVWTCAERFWPGPLTLVLPKAPAIPLSVTAGGQTVAVRMPNHPVAHLLLALADRPVVAPSANLFTRPSPTTAQHVLADLAGRIPLIVDGGPTPIGVESTVLDLTRSQPTILRAGGLPQEAIAQILPQVLYTPRYHGLDHGLGGDDAPLPSPGMMVKHYAPGVPLHLFDGGDAQERMWQGARQFLTAGQRVGMMIVDEDMTQAGEWTGHANLVVASLGSQAEPEQVAQRLFAAMRSLEQAGVDCILARTLPREGVGQAVWDRLLRATEGRVIR